MGKQLKGGGPATPAAIDAADNATQELQARERLLAIRLGPQGDWTREKIAQTWGRGRDPMVRWVRTSREGGVQRRLARRYEGRRARLSEDAQQAWREGLRRGPWKTAKEIRRWRQRARGIALQLGGVYDGLNRLEASGKVPRKSQKKKTPPKKRRFNASVCLREQPGP